MSKIDIFVGIDPGMTNLALCAFSPSRNIVSMHKPVPVKDKIKLDGIDRLSFLMYEIKMWLDDLNKIGTVQQICVEGYANGAKYGREASGETRAIILLALVGWYGLNDPVGYPSIVPPNNLKQFVMGRVGPKEQMLLETYKRWGVEFKDNNLCDAYGLSRVAHALYCGSAVTKFQQDVIDKLRKHTQWNPALHLDSPQETVVTPYSSKLEQLPTQPQLPGLSPTPSMKERKSSSGPSERVRLIRRLKPVR